MLFFGFLSEYLPSVNGLQFVHLFKQLHICPQKHCYNRWMFPLLLQKRNKMENFFFANMGPMINCRLINLHMLNTSMFTLLSGFIAKINKSFLAQNTSALRNNISFFSFVYAKKTKLLMMNKSCFEISRTFRKVRTQVLLTTTIITSYGYSKTFIERWIEENCKS